MPTIRLYHAIREQRDAQAVHDAATFNGNYGPPRSLPPGSALIIRLSQANQELYKAMEEAKAVVEAVTDAERRLALRLSGERDVTRYLLTNLRDNGYEFRPYDSEGGLSWSNNIGAVLDYIMDLDECHLDVRTKATGERKGHIFFVRGNSPEELIADYAVRIEPLLVPTFKYIKSFYDPTYILPEEL